VDENNTAQRDSALAHSVGWSDVTVICGHITISMLEATRRTVWSLVVKICHVIRVKLNQLV